MVSRIRRMWSLHVVALWRIGKKCVENYYARAQPLHSRRCRCSCCLNSLKPDERQRNEKSNEHGANERPAEQKIRLRVQKTFTLLNFISKSKRAKVLVATFPAISSHNSLGKSTPNPVNPGS